MTIDSAPIFTKTIKPFEEAYSEELQEIISKPPHWLVQWGVTIFFMLTVLMISASWVIKYPDVVTVSFTLTANDAPRVVVVRNEGKLDRLLVKDGQKVEVGQTLALSESTADHFQVLRLANDIHRFNTSIRNGDWQSVYKIHIVDYTRLGELQTDFQTFAQKLSELKTFLDAGFYQQKRKLLEDDMVDLVEMEKNLIEQKALQKQEYDLGREEFSVQEKLHSERIIAPVEFKKEKAKLLTREIPLKTLASALIQNRTAQTAKRKEILELDNAAAQQKNDFLQALQTLQSSIEVWKQRFMLVAPVGGRVSFLEPLQEQQHLTVGQHLLTVEPTGHSYIGLVKVPQANIGKLAENQKVYVKLDGFPYREYGSIEGRLSALSVTTGADSVYWAYVNLPDQLTTKYGLSLQYRSGLQGVADIVTADRRLLERMISVVRDGGK